MRERCLDTETTGTSHTEGDRIISVGLVEMIDGACTGREQEWFCNPQRPVGDSQRIHGISDAFLADKPLFAEIWPEIDAFVDDARLVAHNASFDIGFLNAELRRLPYPRPALFDLAEAVDTLALARSLYPGQKNDLDALLTRYRIGSKTARGVHGALKDARLLAPVYVELLIDAQGGRQRGLDLGGGNAPPSASEAAGDGSDAFERLIPPSRLTDAERARHAAFVDTLGPGAIWRQYARQAAVTADHQHVQREG